MLPIHVWNTRTNIRFLKVSIWLLQFNNLCLFKMCRNVSHWWYKSLLFTGSITVSEFVNTSMSVLEGLSQHPVILAEYSQVVLERILPTLADLIGSQNGMLNWSIYTYLPTLTDLIGSQNGTLNWSIYTYLPTLADLIGSQNGMLNWSIYTYRI